MSWRLKIWTIAQKWKTIDKNEKKEKKLEKVERKMKKNEKNENKNKRTKKQKYFLVLFKNMELKIYIYI